MCVVRHNGAMAHLNLSEAELRTRSSLKWRVYPPDVLPLWVAEMDVHVHPAVTDAVTDALHRGDTGYPWGDAYAEAFADMAAARWNWRPDPATQMLRSGDVMGAMLQVLLGTTQVGDAVVINSPVYPPFWDVVRGYGRRVLDVPLTAAGRLDLPAIESALAGPDRPKAYLLCSPHNPTGTVHTADELAALASACEAHQVMLIADEIHAPLVDAGTTFVPLLSVPQAQHAVVCTSAGKGWNLPAFKGGLFLRGEGTPSVFDTLPPLALGAMGHMAKIAHTAALRHAQGWIDEVMAEVTANKRLLAGLLDRHLPDVTAMPGPATYLAWLDCSALGLANPYQHFLAHARVALNPGTAFGFGFGPVSGDDGARYRQFVRINLATSPEIITEAIQRIGRSV